jgi:hypothetical protein
MALFTFWRDLAAAGRPAEQLHRLLLDEAHIVPDATTRRRVDSEAGAWNFAAYATRSHFYAARDQVWHQAGEGVCAIHGLIWRMVAGRAELLDAAAVARLLDKPGATLPDDVAGEYAVARLHSDGSLTAFSDRSGLHQLFHTNSGAPVVANRAGLVATVLDDWAPDPLGLSWLPTIGYRIGTATAYRAVTQLGQEHVLTIDGDGAVARRTSSPLIRFDGARGWSPALDTELDEGIAQAQAAVLLAAGDKPSIDLPITGGKDSRVILALCLAAGLRHRLRLFTRGYAGHPDVVAGEGIAAALGLPHRREAPHGSDEPAHWSCDRFFEKLMAQVYQSDGMVGGWDLILGERIAAETLITGHMGEVLKAYSKKVRSWNGLDPIAMVRLQAPFDPIGLLRPAARETLRDQLAAQMERERFRGAAESDLPDLFYYRNRVPNWLGAIRGIKSFERQPVVPLGVPALLRLAFRLTAEERQTELLHYLIIQRCAPELLAQPFALQQWDARLGDDVPRSDPIRPGEGAPAIFGNWQYSINHNPSIRAALATEIEARGELTLWRSFDRKALLDRLSDRRFDYFDGISMLGLVAALFQESAMIRPVKIGAAGRETPPPARPAGFRLDYRKPGVEGRLDKVDREDGKLIFDGWAYSPGLPAAQLAIELRAGDEVLAIDVADRPRPDLARHGKGDGQHGLRLQLPGERLRAAAGGEAAIDLTLTRIDGGEVIARATVEV